MAVKRDKVVQIRVTRLDPQTLERVRRAAAKFGARTDAAVARFCFEQFVSGKSIRDFEGPDEQSVERPEPSAA